jgi:hypothetical protein
MTIAEWRDSKMTRPFETVLAEWTSLKERLANLNERLAKLDKEIDESFLIMKKRGAQATSINPTSKATTESILGVDLNRLRDRRLTDAINEYLIQSTALGHPRITYGDLYDDLLKVPSIKPSSTNGKHKFWHETQATGWKSLCTSLGKANRRRFRTSVPADEPLYHATRSDWVELATQPKQPRE